LNLSSFDFDFAEIRTGRLDLVVFSSLDLEIFAGLGLSDFFFDLLGSGLGDLRPSDLELAGFELGD
jgi:hypothetical protein